MRVLIKRRGGSGYVRIPGSVMQAAALTIDQAVDVREDGGRVVIERIPPSNDDLDALLARMKPETFPGEMDFGRPVGGEPW